MIFHKRVSAIHCNVGVLVQVLESHWKEIRDEGLANLNEKGLFEIEAEDLRDTGDWKQFTLYTQGRLIKSFFSSFHQVQKPLL